MLQSPTQLCRSLLELLHVSVTLPEEPRPGHNTNAGQRGSITSLDLQATLFLRHSRKVDALGRALPAEPFSGSQEHCQEPFPALLSLPPSAAKLFCPRAAGSPAGQRLRPPDVTGRSPGTAGGHPPGPGRSPELSPELLPIPPGSRGSPGALRGPGPGPAPARAPHLPPAAAPSRPAPLPPARGVTSGRTEAPQGRPGRGT
ncbi:WW domain-binding protein 11-like [Ammospiza caudacuta]|uniref:WW domain-binding protein 11-like n=1 Tax=Ammospiza caudacuta TaxID=2857398 RepID=UPI002738A778|nr:WW domain-binding protein 11-like [Ammospiza caudacuta]